MKNAGIILLIILILGLTGVGVYFEIRWLLVPSNPKENKNVVYDDTTSTAINLSDLKEVNGVEVKDNVVTIRRNGTYLLSGSIEGNVIVDASGKDVILQLSNVKITSKEESAIFVKDAKKVTLEFVAGTKNYLTSSTDAVISSQSELAFAGRGMLEVKNETGHGIVLKDKAVTFESGIVEITSKKSSVVTEGTGSVTMSGGTVMMTGENGIVTSEMATIQGGVLFVDADKNSIQATKGVVIHGGNVVALGVEKITNIDTSSKQNVILLGLDTKTKANTVMRFVDKTDKEMVSFLGTKEYQSVLVSRKEIVNGEYSFYLGGSHTGTLNHGVYQEGTYTAGLKVKVGEADIFTVSGNVTQVEAKA